MSDTIRVAIACEGLFRLSDEAILRCIEKGMTLAPPLPEDVHQFQDGYDFYPWGKKHEKKVGQKYHARGDMENTFRTNPIILSVLEEMGDEAMALDRFDRESRVGKVKIIEIPFPSAEGWTIRWFECSTGEYICENHRTWE